ncbi:MAG: hypothetical protein AAGC47_03860 [Bacteroidota bacterium]
MSQIPFEEKPFRLRLFHFLKYQTQEGSAKMQRDFPSLKNDRIFCEEIIRSQESKKYYDFLRTNDYMLYPEKSFETFKTEILNDTLSLYQLDLREILKATQEDLRSKFFFKKYSWEDWFFLKIFLGVTTLTFIGRYVLLALIWSLRQMKE